MAYMIIVSLSLLPKGLQRQLQEQQEDLKAMRGERERLEQSNERLRKDLQMSHQSADLAYAQVEKEVAA